MRDRAQIHRRPASEAVQRAVQEMRVVENSGHRHAIPAADVERRVRAVEGRGPRTLIAHEQLRLTRGAGRDADQQFGLGTRPVGIIRP